MKSLRAIRRGVASVIAMFYLVLFSTLAVGAYAAVTCSLQISYNERNINAARAAAESGMEFIRYQLAQLNIPQGTAPASIFGLVYAQLNTALVGTGNLGGDIVAYDSINQVITIPATSSNWITLNSDGSKFRVTITANALQLIVKITGQAQNAVIQRAVQMHYGIAQRASSIFNYGVANRGSISMAGNAKILGATDSTKGSVLSAAVGTNTPVTMSGNPQISGDVSLVNPNGHIAITGSPTIAGYSQASPSFTDHVHIGVPAPTFPTIDSTVFAQYATTTWTTHTGRTLSNMIIPANSNPTFNGNTTIKGILYIQAPNQVNFSGNTTIQGCIVVQNSPPGTPATNVINFGGNVTATGIDTLPSGTYSAGERALTNVFLLAPNFSVTFTGNFGTIGGSMIASNFTFSGNAGGTVVGSVIGLDDMPMSLTGSSDIIISSTGTTQYPPGVFFGQDYVPLSDTWQEVHP